MNGINTPALKSSVKVCLDVWHKRTCFHEDLLAAVGNCSIFIAAFHKVIVHVAQRPRDGDVFLAELLRVGELWRISICLLPLGRVTKA